MIDYAKALNQAQLEAVCATEDHQLVVAGAGSGKTRTIVYRLAWLLEQGLDPSALLLLTFTRKAAQEMLERAGLLLGRGLSGLAGGTFHSFAYSALRRWHPHWLGERSFTVLDQADINAAIKQCKEALGLGRNDRAFPKSVAIAALLSKSRNKELPIEEVLRREATHLLPYADDLARIGKSYDEYRRANALLDYDDLLFELEALFLANGEAAEALRLRHSHILVDEYQDTNLVQARLVRLLGGPLDAPPKGKVMAVGDEAQSIYAFRGANVRNILDFPKSFPNARVIPLEENYRSTQPVLAVANNLLSHACESFRKTLFTRRAGGEPVRLIRPISDLSQATLLTKRIEELLQKYPPEGIAVLFRAGFHSYHLEMALGHAGIAFRKYGGLRYTEAAHVKDILAFGRLALNPLDLPSFARLAAMHPGIGPKTIQKLHQVLRSGHAEELKKALTRFPALAEDLAFLDELRRDKPLPENFFSRVLDYYRPRLEALYPEDWPRRLQGLEEIIQMATGYSDLDLFLAELALAPPEDEEISSDQPGRITLSTIHSAKGLEWSAVLLLDLVEDRFPSRHALTRPEDYEEERRLMYVACTRAREILELYAPTSIYSRSEGGNVRVAQSPFLREMPPGIVEEWLESYEGQISPGSSKPINQKGMKQALAGLGHSPGQNPVFHHENQELCEQSSPKGILAEAPLDSANSPLGYCRHRIFGRGKIVRRISPEKVQVNFPGFGLKMILSDYLLPED